MPGPWTVLTRQTLIADPWLRLHAERVRTGTGAELEPWYVFEAAHWVTIVPVLPDGRVVLVEQYRHGAQRICRELPAGNIDHGEDPALAAVRELREETGYVPAAPPILLATLYPEPSRSRVTATGFVMRCQAIPRAQELDVAGGEDLAVVTVPVAELYQPGAAGIIHGTQLAFIQLARAHLGL